MRHIGAARPFPDVAHHPLTPEGRQRANAEGEGVAAGDMRATLRRIVGQHVAYRPLSRITGAGSLTLLVADVFREESLSLFAACSAR